MPGGKEMRYAETSMELILAAVSGRYDVWSCTHLELVRYLKAMEAYERTGENRSNLTLWIEEDGKIQVIRPKEA
jgi:hypothetical protein